MKSSQEISSVSMPLQSSVSETVSASIYPDDRGINSLQNAGL
jgi:hypothetical protein